MIILTRTYFAVTLYVFLLFFRNTYSRQNQSWESVFPIEESPGIRFFGYWFTKGISPAPAMSPVQTLQITIWAEAILFHHPDAHIYLFVQEGSLSGIHPRLELMKTFHILNIHHFSEILHGTPAASVHFSQRTSPAQISDLCRLAMLYRWGGSWIDMDDILLRPIVSPPNTIGVAEFPANTANCPYMICRFSRASLIPGRLMSRKKESYGIHVQNDPMLNWEPGNSFLFAWMSASKSVKDVDWGQTLPTDIIRNNESWVTDGHVTLQPQYELLMHPAYATANGKIKGPLFPPYFLAEKGIALPHYDTAVNKSEFMLTLILALEVSPFFAVKNSKSTGILQCQAGEEQPKWLVGWISDCHSRRSFLRILESVVYHSTHLLTQKLQIVQNTQYKNNTGIILGSYPQSNYSFRHVATDAIPWIAYNPSIVRIPPSLWTYLCEKIHNDASGCSTHQAVFAISWYVKPPRRDSKYGCLIWIGFISASDLALVLEGRYKHDTSLKSNFWMSGYGAPRMLKNVLGPKVADPRLFLFSSQINVTSLALVGYARLAPRSNTPGIADYYVRASVVEARSAEESLCQEVNRTCAFSAASNYVGCFSARFDCCVPSVDQGGDLFLPCQDSSCNTVTPHASRDSLVPPTLRLNGFEVSSVINSTNENHTNHISTKNIVPLVTANSGHLPDRVAVFVDFVPPTPRNMVRQPVVSAMDLTTGEVLGVWSMRVDGQGISASCLQLTTGKWRGSTQLVSLALGRASPVGRDLRDEKVFVTVLHHRRYSNSYSHAVAILIGQERHLRGRGKALLPLTCAAVINDVPLHHATTKKGAFAFGAGLAGLPEGAGRGWSFVLTAGLSNNAPYLSKIDISTV